MELVLPDGSGGGGPSPLWDDAAFVRRVAALARDRGKTLREVCKQADLSADYLNKTTGRVGRNIGHILKIARVLDVGVAEILGVGATDSDQAAQETAATIRRLALVADVAAHLYVALSARGVVPVGTDKLINEILQMAGRAA